MTSNVALNKDAFLSTEYAVSGSPSLAVDGNTDGDWETGRSCAHSESEVHPWWAVDLGSATSVYEVEISNRMECCSGTTQFIMYLVCNCNDFA